MSILISGGTVIDPAGERRVDVRIAGGRIAEVGDSLTVGDDDQLFDATGRIVCPGFVDLHTHLREPGREEAETIETGSRAAAKGGYTCVIAMPNTDPTQDSVSVVEFVRRQGEAAGLCDVRPSGSITIGRKGERLSPLAELAEAGVHLFTDDGDGVQDPLLMRRGPRVRPRPPSRGARHRARPALRGEAAHRGCRHARGALLLEVRSARLAVARRGAHGPPRHRAGASHRGAGPPPAPVDGGERRAGAPRQGRRSAGHGRGRRRTTSA